MSKPRSPVLSTRQNGSQDNPLRLESLTRQEATDALGLSVRQPHAAPLPTPPTGFVGRGAEMAVVAALLKRDDARLLTLTGPGGSGTTRLAPEVASWLAPEFADGAAPFPLTPVRDPNLVAATITLRHYLV